MRTNFHLTPVGGHRAFLDNGFQPSTTPVVVASGNISKNSLWAIMIVFLLILQVFTKQAFEFSNDAVLEDVDNNTINANQLDNFNLEYGSDIIGQYIDHDGFYNAEIRPESDIYSFHDEMIYLDSTNMSNKPDIVFGDNLMLDACWLTTDGKLIHYSADKLGESNISVVDTVIPIQDVSEIPSCAITVKENGRVSILYSNGSDIKSAQIAYESPLYSNGNDWHTRTIFENVNPTVLDLSVMPSQHEVGVFVNNIGQLYQINYTGAFWQNSILDNGPVGNDVKVEIDSDGKINVFYTKNHQAILLSVHNGESVTEIVSQGPNLTSDIGLTLDEDELVQLYTSEYSEGTTIFDIRRSLINQKNQISSEPVSQFNSSFENSTVSNIRHGDINNDGFDDLVYSEPYADSNGLTDNGVLSIHLGSVDGLAQTPSMTFTGEQDYANLGMSLAVADFDGDGYDDIAVGSPGYSNNDGLVEFIFGSNDVVSLGLEQVQGLSSPQVSGERYGINLEPVDDLNFDGFDELLVCSKPTQGGDTGKVTLFAGDLKDTNWNLMDSPNQLLLGANFGQSVSASGDVNGDGIADLVIGNTGNLQQNTGYSSVEVRFGGTDGYSSDPDVSFQSSISGTLFGYDVEIINDLNGDGYDEIIISEPYNLSGSFNSGNLWIFLGNSSSINPEPDYRISGEANQQLGFNIESIGDSNQDGFNDFTATSRDENGNGIIRLYSGSDGDFTANFEIIARGEPSLGFSSTYNIDSNGDGLSEFIFSQEHVNTDSSFYSTLYQYSRNLWQNISVIVDGLVTGGEIQTSYSGEPSIGYISEHNSATQFHIVKPIIGSESNVFLQHNITKRSGQFISGNFELSQSGEPIIFLSVNGTGVVKKEFDSRVLLENNIYTGSTDSKYIDVIEAENGVFHLAYYSEISGNIFLNSYEQGVWSESIVATGYQINHDIVIQLDENSEPIIFFRDNLSKDIYYSKFNQTWEAESLGTNGQAKGQSFDVIKSSNDEFIAVTVLDDGNFQNLTLISSNLTNHTIEFIGFESDLNINLSLMQDYEGTYIVAGFTQQGALYVYEKPLDDAAWNQQSVEQPHGTIFSNALAISGIDQPVIMVNSEYNSLYIRTEGQWSPLADMPNSLITNEFELYSGSNEVLFLAENAMTNNLQWNSLSLKNYSNSYSNWYSFEIDQVKPENEITLVVDANHTLHIVVRQEDSPDLFSLRAYKDVDSDHIFDAIDDLPNTPNQWEDSDNDGYGENQHGPQSDDCPNVPGTSVHLIQGCNDLDGDGYDDLTDNCNSAYGFSWLDRYGCTDFDQDGWSDYNSQYRFGDVFPDNWKQAFDSDGDSYGDNHGPDCCDTWYDTDARTGDLFPFNPRQYTDYDNDGYGDNSSDVLTGDACKFQFGTSYLDRLGCLDSDGDGASDPSAFWNESLGADIWPNDPTQWADSDGDGFGDNSSEDATNPDHFPNNIAATNDTDNDGYPDSFTDFYNGSNSGGLYIDGCPLVSGNSSNPLFGCLDSDGDSFMDIYSYDINSETGLRDNQSGDAFPFDPVQWSDLDGDGFGDFQGHSNSDVCPSLPGVLNGTIGVGCPLIDGNDDDGDMVINAEDLCPDTQLGKPVDQYGCALYQIDTDNDGIFDDVDICPNTAQGAAVDNSGCSQQQVNSDLDNDGVLDLQDVCPGTPQNEQADEVGCSSSQSDADLDGVFDYLDLCPDTPSGYVVDSDGCADESSNNVDNDMDGYSGIYRFEVNTESGLRFNQSGDLFPEDASQWWDTDGDSYGDNSSSLNGDSCPFVNGASFFDRYGCADSDSDGWSDPTSDWFASPSGLADAFPNDSTQWKDTDGDSYGDNITGLSPDLCPSTNPIFIQEVDINGCAPYERDTDSDGVVDSLDNCPTEAKGIDGYIDGCPLEKQTEASSSAQILGIPITWFIAIVVVIVVLLILLVIRRNRLSDDEDWYDDDYEDEDYEDDRLSFLDRNQQRNQPTAPIRLQELGPDRPPQRGPVGAPQPRTDVKSSVPIKANAPRVGPPRFNQKTIQQSKSKSPGKKVAKKIKQSDDSSKKVRRAVVEVDEDIFENVPQSSIDGAIDELSSYSLDNERQILMYLQEKGWNAPQSRAIINLAKTKSR